MNREKFNEIIMKQYREFESKEIAKSPEQIFFDSYEISKMIALKDYLTEEDDSYIERLYLYAETILYGLYDYELRYDTPQWTTWENISNMCEWYLNNKEDE